MKRILLTLLIGLSSMGLYAQTDGLNYQAVIINPEALELPGANAEGTILPNTDVTLRFSILDSSGSIEYLETQSTRTDAYGMVNVLIGAGQSADGRAFTDIQWDGTRKDLKVDVSFGGQFKELSNQRLTFIPYAFHRDIIATGTLNVEGEVVFKDNLVVDGTTDLNGDLSVNNESETKLTGTLTVDGATVLNNTLDVKNESVTRLSGTLEVDGASSLRNTLVVQEATNLNSTLEVEGATTLRNNLDVINESTTVLSGTLRVDGVTDLNNTVNINNNSELNVSGDLNVDGATLFNDDLTVNGDTNLNSSLSVNNNSPTTLTGTLGVEQATTLGNSLQVSGLTNLESALNVNNQSPTQLSGSLTVDLETNLNSSLSVNNGSPTFLSGPLEVDGPIGLNNNLTVNGITNLNDALFVNNAAPTNLSGTLDVAGATDMDGTLLVDGTTTLNDNLIVANGSSTSLSGFLTVDQATTLNNSLTVANGSPTSLTGTLIVDEATTLNNSLEVANGTETSLTGTLSVEGETTLNNNLTVLNGSETSLSGMLTVDGETTLNNSLEVTNASPTNLTGTLSVDGLTNLEDVVNVAGATTINNDLTVTGNTFLGSLNTETINIESDNPNFIATFSNTNAANGDGIAIKLGRTHGAWDGSQFLKVVNPLIGDPDATPPVPPIDTRYQTAVAVVKNQFQNPGTFTVSEVINLAPTALRAGGITAINQFVFNQMNTSLGLPKNLAPVNFPGQTLTQTPPPPPPFPGVTIPFVNVTIPGWQVPTVSIPGQNLLPGINNFIPSLPFLDQTGGLPNVEFPNIPRQNVANSLSKANEYVSFQDKDGRVTGSIRAQSLEDFANETVCNPVYLMNVLSKFVGVDLLDGIVAGSVEMTNLIDKFNSIGVEYTSGNGDYAEWLPRANFEEFISAGDIVAVSGGEITKDLSNVEQIMVVSHQPIILGNEPIEGKSHLGNNVAFMGQVPVKILGPVNTGDYIVADTTIKGYGTAVSPKEMTAAQFELAVGRAWEENLNEGPKMVNTVVGVHNGDWANIVKKIQEKQRSYEVKYKAIEAKVNALDRKADELLIGTNK
ncbi:MAG: hypothetical protein AAFP76_09360 [Bacteroidota bacterium]